MHVKIKISSERQRQRALIVFFCERNRAVRVDLRTCRITPAAIKDHGTGRSEQPSRQSALINACNLISRA
jgi:hypothetical protein